MKSEFRFRVLALAVSFLVPLFLSLAAPRLELFCYDNFQVYYDSLSMSFREILGPPPFLHCSLVLLGERETRDLDKSTQQMLTGPWGAEQDLNVGRRLVAGGARAVVFLRHYTDKEQQMLLGQGPPRSLLPVVGVPDSTPVDLSAQKQAGKAAWGYPDDADKMVRRFYVALHDKDSGKFTPALPLVLYADYLGESLSDASFTSTKVRLGKREIPVQDDGIGLSCSAELYDVRADMADMQADSFESFENHALGYPVPLQSLLSDRNPLFEKAEGRYFFIGNFQYAPDRIVDTPKGAYRDFQLLAVALDTLIHGHELQVSRGLMMWGLWLLIDLLLDWLILGQPTAMLLLARAFLCMVTLIFSEFVLLRCGFYVPFVGPALGLCLLTGMSGLRLWVTAVHLLNRFGGRAAGMAAQWGFDRDRMDEIDERDATILFINLPEYFKTLERLNSPNLFERRKEFSTMVANISHSFGGIIHDYQADALMIGFGTDVLHREPQHAVRAVETARQLQAGFRDLSSGWLDAMEPEQLHLSAGICTGFVAVGFVGAARHKKSPAAIGDTTNVAARLLGAARKQGVDILISKPTFLGCQRWVEAEELPPVALKGKTHPVEIYAVRRIDWEVNDDA